MPRFFTCPQGHQWHVADHGPPLPAGVAEVCPYCGAAGAASVADAAQAETSRRQTGVPATKQDVPSTITAFPAAGGTAAAPRPSPESETLPPSSAPALPPLRRV